MGGAGSDLEFGLAAELGAPLVVELFDALEVFPEALEVSSLLDVLVEVFVALESTPLLQDAIPTTAIEDTSLNMPMPP